MHVCLIDSGGILFSNVTEDSEFFALLGSRFGVDGASVREEYEARDAEFEVGRTTATEVLVSALLAAGAAPDEVTDGEIRELYRRSLAPNREVFEILASRPRGDGHPFVALANNEARDWDAIKHATFRHLDLFDAIASSWAVGHVKPSPEYFAAALAVCGAEEPADATLVDDDAGCLAAARALGLRCVEFAGPASLLETLGSARAR